MICVPPTVLPPPVTAITDTGFHGFAAAVLAVRQHLRQGFAIMQVLRMTDHRPQ